MTGTDPRPVARRVMKARRRGVCAACRAPISVGQRIGLTGAGWCHVIPCIIGDRTQDVPAANPPGGAPTEGTAS